MVSGRSTRQVNRSNQSKASDRIVTHQIAVDDVVLVQRDERAEALPSDLLPALHLLDGAAVTHRGVGAGVGAGRGSALAEFFPLLASAFTHEKCNLGAPDAPS